MTAKPFAKISVSLPHDLAAFVEKHSKQSGHSMKSRTIQQAIALLMKREAGKK
jgi:metal-responsive CopG/Arc/MetJ family transcriptional regulator